jgi:pyruvate/2-oxoglutarate dehydrogenase complex dihydrolipoamide dehydrogenase (E3) component
VILEDGSQVDGDDLPVATGRAPVTADLGLPAAGVEITDRGFIRVDNFAYDSRPCLGAGGPTCSAKNEGSP